MVVVSDGDHLCGCVYTGAWCECECLEAYLEPSWTSTMEFFSQKSSIVDVRLDSRCTTGTSDVTLTFSLNFEQWYQKLKFMEIFNILWHIQRETLPQRTKFSKTGRGICIIFKADQNSPNKIIRSKWHCSSFYSSRHVVKLRIWPVNPLHKWSCLVASVVICAMSSKFVLVYES